MLSETASPIVRRAGARPPLPDLPASVWRADELSTREADGLSTGCDRLDAALPGGGWPVGALVEVLQQEPQQQVWQLLSPALSLATRRRPGPVVVVAAPQPLFAPALAARGIAPDRWLWVQAQEPSARLWAAEQALRCAQAAAVLVWLPRAQAGDLRRLHLAAQQHRQLLFALRPASAQAQASPAPLRVLLSAQEPLQLQVLKRRGPPLQGPLHPVLPGGLVGPWLRAGRGAGAQPSEPAITTFSTPGLHGLDRAATLA